MDGARPRQGRPPGQATPEAFKGAVRGSSPGNALRRRAGPYADPAPKYVHLIESAATPDSDRRQEERGPGGQWSEIDLANKVWAIPDGRMGRIKGGVEHRIPLVPQAVALLEGLPRIVGNLYLFPGARTAGRPLSNMALLQLMRGMGHEVNGHLTSSVPHGFRSSFRNWSGEVSSFPRDVCEMALAHAVENKVEAGYRRGDLFEKRRQLMEAWANYGLGAGADVVSMDARRVA